jgi:hypothetical protein
MKRPAVLLMGTCLSLGAPGFAADGPPCSSVDNGSCWHVINASRETVTLSCRRHGDRLEFRELTLGPGETFSRQFPRDHGDGLGYPEPETPYTLTVAYADHGQVNLDFHTAGWGDRVELRVEDAKVTVTLREFWWDHEPYVFEKGRGE